MVCSERWLRTGGDRTPARRRRVLRRRRRSASSSTTRIPRACPTYSPTPKRDTAGPRLSSRSTRTRRRPDARPVSGRSGKRGRILYYRNPMGLPDTSPVPKKDSMGMDYIPVYEDEAGGRPRHRPGQPAAGADAGRAHRGCGAARSGAADQRRRHGRLRRTAHLRRVHQVRGLDRTAAGQRHRRDGAPRPAADARLQSRSAARPAGVRGAARSLARRRGMRRARMRRGGCWTARCSGCASSTFPRRMLAGAAAGRRAAADGDAALALRRHRRSRSRRWRACGSCRANRSTRSSICRRSG